MTTAYEIEAGSDLCEMIGLDRDQSMGHLVAEGSIANIEAIWVARNLKYYPLGLQEALLKDEKLRGAREYELPSSKGLQYSSCKCHTMGATQSGYGHHY